jgi:hypothetical protein
VTGRASSAPLPAAAPRLLLVLAVLALLDGCGKKGPPVPAGPPDQITYPRSYPSR